jgi:hypothetical protein
MFTALNNAYQDHTDHDGQGTSPYQLISILGSALTSQTPEPYETEPERRAQADEDDISADTDETHPPRPGTPPSPGRSGNSPGPQF